MDHEQVVLQPAPALGEADAVLEQHRSPEQLVRRQQPEELHGVERRCVHALAEQRARHGLAVADDLADDDVRSVARRGGVHALQRVVLDPVVVVDEVDELAACQVDADVAGPAGPARVRDVHDLDVGVLGRQRVKPGRRPVGRAVVDEDELERAGRHGLSEQRIDAVVDVPAGVVDRDDHADGGLHREHNTSCRSN